MGGWCERAGVGANANDAAAAMVSARINSLSAWMAARRSKKRVEEDMVDVLPPDVGVPSE